MKLVIALATLATIVCALPTTDDIVLEQVGSFVPEITALQTGSSGPREAAVKAYRFLQQNGNDDAACRALANSMIAEVNSTVTTAQANINAVDDGSTCGSTYQTEVDAATTANTNAQNALTEAQTALNSAQAQSVTLVQAYTVDPAVTYFTNNPAWVAARTAHDSATSALATAQGAATAAASALTEAQATQTHQINVCRCTAQTAMAAALSTNANNNNAQQNTANWNQAHNLLCVLDNTNPCNFAPAPTVQGRTLPADVSGATCPAPAAGGPTYTEFANSGCHGRNELGIENGRTLASCQAECDTNAACISFEFNPSLTRCQHSTSCTEARKNAANGWTLYIKN